MVEELIHYAALYIAARVLALHTATHCNAISIHTHTHTHTQDQRVRHTQNFYGSVISLVELYMHIHMYTNMCVYTVSESDTHIIFLGSIIILLAELADMHMHMYI